jgi:hypothetical protein
VVFIFFIYLRYSEKVFEAELSATRKPLSQQLMLQDGEEEALDFCELLLQWSPLKRMEVHEAIQHPYVIMYVCNI